jgi:hypothetical protein
VNSKDNVFNSYYKGNLYNLCFTYYLLVDMHLRHARVYEKKIKIEEYKNQMLNKLRPVRLAHKPYFFSQRTVFFSANQ